MSEAGAVRHGCWLPVVVGDHSVSSFVSSCSSFGSSSNATPTSCAFLAQALLEGRRHHSQR